MKWNITKKYLVFPVNINTSQKKLFFREEGELLIDLDIKLDNITPAFWAYVDVKRFIGKTLDLEVVPEMTLTFEEADTMDLDGLWQENYRPQVHFTVKNGWNNDPNGMIYQDGIYHMFYQYNPCEPWWNNMHWGHAISEDMLHWEEQDVALFPDKQGTMFSGSAITDFRNVSGLGKDGKVPMLLYYTAAGNTSELSKGRKFTQCLAYSLDGGKTFEKYEGNPVVAHFEAENRDPKVVWVEEIERYIMVIFLNDDRYLMLESQDLLHFRVYQKISLKGDAECPDLFFLQYNGKKVWVLIGASDRYVIGRFTKDGFVIESTEKKLSYGVGYAAQSFSGMEDERVVRVWWDRMMQIPKDGRFTSHMSIPTDMSLENINDTVYLCAQPIMELESLRGEEQVMRGFVLNAPMKFEADKKPVEMILEMPYDAAVVLEFDIFGEKLICDMTNNQIRYKTVKMPISVDSKKVKLHMIVDRSIIEVYADGGKFCFAEMLLCDDNLPRIILSTDKEVNIDHLEWYSLQSIH